MKTNEHVPTGEKMEIASSDVANLSDVLGVTKKPAKPGLVCKACGRFLKDRADASACDDVGPHAPVMVDLNTAVVDKAGRVVRAVHLE